MKANAQSLSGDDLLAALVDLMNVPALTASEFRAQLAEHPELLGDEAQLLLRAVAHVQDSQQARQQVEHMAALLARIRKDGVDSVLVEEGERVRRQLAKERRAARHQTARESFLAWRREAKPPATDIHAERRLPALSDVVAGLRSISVDELPQPFGFDVLGRQPAQLSPPRFLFRGESGAYPQTCSSIARLRMEGKLAQNALDDIDRISEALVLAFHEKWGMTRAQALGFLQHYGFPTEYLDVTSDVSVAASFASRLRVGDEGAMCVVPTAHFLPMQTLVDLRYHPIGKRPRLQSAFAVHLPQYPNLKSPEAVEALNLTWISFRFTDTDAARFVPDFELLDARSDEVAGLIWLLIDDAAKFDDKLARLLSSRIDAAPLIAVAMDDGSIALTCEDDAPIEEEEVSDKAFQDMHYERWSDAFAEAPRQQLMPELEGMLAQDAALRPGDVLRILTSRAIGMGRRKG